MRPLVLLWGCLVLPGYEALQGPKEISGFEGDTVSLQCTYSEELRAYKKYWCRQAGFLLLRCSGIIYAGEEGQETTQGRVSILDRPQELALTVTLRNLTLQDAGKYWCGVKKLGFDESFLVSLLVFQGPCCPPSPTPSFQPLATRSPKPKAKAWQTQPPEPTSPGRYPTVTTAKQGKTGAQASPVTGTSPYGHAGPSLHTGTSPHAATSPHAGSSRPTMQLDSARAKDTRSVPSRSSSKPRVSIPLVRMLAPVLVLFGLLLATGLIGLGSRMLRRRKQAQLAVETQRNEKVYPSHLTTEEEEPPSQDLEGDMIPVPPFHMSEEDLGFSKFISV
ncbi:CMRF35-like molecule 9 isoform X1 [Microcebus murinus]|uniref:CMRF35-like molecule 9 isoform X1 n=1 Tax=Microcebus murinus TaxID=30608 RepID=UPI003F6CA211